MDEFDMACELGRLAKDARGIEDAAVLIEDSLRWVMKHARIYKKGFDEASALRAEVEGHLRRAEREICRSLDTLLEEEMSMRRLCDGVQ